MAEQRKKSSSILLNIDGKNISLELFPSEEWPNEPSGEGLFRVRIDGKWHSPFGKYTFMTMSRVGELVAGLLAGHMQQADRPLMFLTQGFAQHGPERRQPGAGGQQQ